MDAHFRHRRRTVLLAAFVVLAGVVTAAPSTAAIAPQLAAGGARVYPAGIWKPAAQMVTTHVNHTATRLTDGRVLVAGGGDVIDLGRPVVHVTAASEVYSPTTRAWTSTGSLKIARFAHTANLLVDGRVLVLGGFGTAGILASGELYDPASGAWTATPNMSSPRFGQTATRLRDGRVLVAGGSSPSGQALTTAEVFDPSSNSWSPAADMPAARMFGATALLSDGRVLVVGGGTDFSANSALASSAIYDPASNAWTVGPSLPAPLNPPTATVLADGRVLVLGGSAVVRAGQIFDPGTNHWSPTAPMARARPTMTATRLTGRRVLVTSNGSSQVYDPATDQWSTEQDTVTPRTSATATLLLDGSVLLAAGREETPSSSERFVPCRDHQGACAGRLIYPAGVHVTGTTAEPHLGGAAALLADGRVLLAGGYDPTSGAVLASAELYDPGTGRWTATGRMSLARGGPITATRLPDGRVLVTGGWSDTFSGTTKVEIYNPSTGSWSTAAPLGTARYHDQAVALTSGRVLVIGGWNDTTPAISTAEQFDPATGHWSAAGTLPVAPVEGFTATRLRDGRVLVTGGASATTALYDPATNQWTAGPTMHAARRNHTATLLRNGRVLVTGGRDPSGSILRSTEIYDPQLNRWTTGPALARRRAGQTANRLPDGRVLVARGTNVTGGLPSELSSTEVYDPKAKAWLAGPDLGAIDGAAIRLADGRILFAGDGTLGSAGLVTAPK